MTEKVTPTKDPSITLRFMAAPTDVVLAGSQGVSGGRVLEWIDKAAYACAVQWSATYCVTAYVGHIHFTRPIPSGHIVEVRSRIAMTGRSSMHIVNEVLSADPREGVFTRACDCLVIFVAKNPETGKSMPVPAFVPTTDEERRVQEAAKSRIQLRDEIETEMLKQSYDGDSSSPAHHPPLHGKTHRHQLGRQSPRRHRHGMDRLRGHLLHHGMVRRTHLRRLRRRHPLLQTHFHR